jgi:ketosteroid isomerase-like protein
MRINTFTWVAAVAGALWLPLHVTCEAAEPAQESQRAEKPKTDEHGFLAALAAADAAQRGLQSGNAEVYKAIWSRSDDVTLIGGFGGGVEKGWQRVSQRIDWVATQFTNGTNTIERLVTHSDGKLGYVVQIERIRFQVPGQTKESTRDYRVTMLFTKEPDGWKLLHRHADSQMMKQAP